tara:strand:+ start:417 stop:788 length:372 start_codon:yes stop_codon:yes gene_type:complete
MIKKLYEKIKMNTAKKIYIHIIKRKIKKIFQIVKKIIIKIFKSNNDEILYIAKRLATIITKETPNKVDDKLLEIINDYAKNLTPEQKKNLSKNLTKESKFIPELVVNFINNKFKIAKKTAKKR